MKLEKERLLIIAPHADDEVLGCFRLINKIKENGGKVFVQVLTMGGYTKRGHGRLTKETWKKEFLKVSKLLKIDRYDIAFYNDEIKHYDNMPQMDLIDYIDYESKVSISKIKPTIVALPTIFSTHQDHVHTYKVTIAALRPHPQKTNPFTNLVLSYESPEYYFWSPYSEMGKFSPNFYLEQSKEQINKKIRTLNVYKSQLRKGQRDGNKVTALAKIRGSEVGLDYAESFHIHRLFTK